MTVARSVDVTRSIPVIASCDVCVVGGGSAGIAASVASARAGAKTILVERYGFLGGASTAGMVGPFMTSWSADGSEPIIAGVFRELVDKMIALGGAIDPATTEPGDKWTGYIALGHANATPFSVEACKLAALQLVGDAEAAKTQPITDAPTVYDIPYRILVPQKLDNLLVAGRPVSATHEAAASVRIIPPCYAMGQAAGLAAALAARGNVAPMDLDIDLLRRELAAQSAIV